MKRDEKYMSILEEAFVVFFALMVGFAALSFGYWLKNLVKVKVKKDE